MRLTSADLPDLARLVHRTARAEGPGAALTAQHAAAGADSLVVGPGGHAVVPVDLAACAAAVMTPNGPPVPLTATTPFTQAALTGSGVTALRCTTPGNDQVHRPSAASAEYRRWLHALTWLRLGLCDRLFDEVLAHLSARTFGRSPLLQQQMVKGSLADAAVERLEVRSMLDAAGPDGSGPGGPELSHERITGIERRLLRLCGAYGFALRGPGTLAYTSELLGDVYVTAGALGEAA